jgi:starch phosphorylase
LIEMTTMANPTQESSPLTLDDLDHLTSRRGQPAETLENIVRLLQQKFATDVCSVYLIEPDRATLVLAATVGLRPESVGNIRMGLHEGLAGYVAEELRPIMVEDASKHPRFKYFRESGEEAYHSFLGVPLIDQGMILGVLVVQTAQPRAFSREEISSLVTTANQLGPIVGEARTLEKFIAPTYERIWALARNFWWSWDAEANSLFNELDPERWRELDHNPVAMLGQMTLDQLDQRAGQLVLHSRLNYAYRRLQEYLQSKKTWGARHTGVLKAQPVAYFSAEFGVHESLPIYSGGLGILAGDHVKSASDLGIPLVGIGLFYAQGYFRQRLDVAGWQNEDYLDVDVRQLPLEMLIGRDNRPVTVAVETRGATISARVWKATVGRNTLLLLDSDVESNTPEDRSLTARLYGGDTRVRIRQELLLGVGGVRALKALSIHPAVLHLNEGHSAFAGLEMVRQRMKTEGIGFDEAMRRVARMTVFTTHTPVPAGHDRFHGGLMEEHLGPMREALGISHDTLMGLGRVHPHDPNEDFCMTVLALKGCKKANAVSSLHGSVSRAMWTSLYPNRPEEEVPIGHITNGVHVHTWLAPQMRRLYDRHLGPEWAQQSGEPSVWEGIENVDAGELWETHQVLKSRLVAFVRQRAVMQAERRGEPKAVIEKCKRALNMDAMTIGFARRFATYKRANMVFKDLEQIAALINDPQLPVQFVFAGKAHPLDVPGKTVLKQIAEFARDPQFAGKLVFVEDYDMNVARHLVQGVDVWLNNPRRPLEASGTSGQKVVLNGGLNLSVLDGWWAEAYDGTNGFAIGMGETHSDVETHDRMDAEGLYKTLTEEVIPLYYERDRDGLPRGWIARMKSAIRSMGWRFNADRMVMDYVMKCYIPAAGGTSSDMSRI